MMSGYLNRHHHGAKLTNKFSGLGIFAILLSLLSLTPCITKAGSVTVAIDDKVSITLTKPTQIRTTENYSSVATITNTSSVPIYAPLSLIVTSISDNSVQFTNALGQTAAGQPYRRATLPDGKLKPGETVANIKFTFKNPNRLDFSFTLIATATNRSPVANAGPNVTASVGSTVTLNGSKSTDREGDLISYQWTLLKQPVGSTVLLLQPDTLHPTVKPDKSGSYLIGLKVNDGLLSSAFDKVVVNTQNSSPFANAGFDQTAKVGDTVTLDGSASGDVNNDPLTYQWLLRTQPEGSTATLQDPDTESPKLLIDKAGKYNVQLIVKDNNKKTSSDRVIVSTTNLKPVAKAGTVQSILLTAPPAPVQLDGGLSFDADNDPLNFTWSLIARPTGSQAALVNSLAPQSQFTPDLIGHYVAQLMVNDSHSDSSPDTTEISVTAATPPQNHPPQITSTPETTAAAGGLYSYPVIATDIDTGDTLSYSLTVAPPDMTIDPNTGSIHWTPLASDSGPHPVTVKVTDALGDFATQSFTLDVMAVGGSITVPTLTNISRSAAENAIQQARLNLGTLSFQNSDTVAEGIVLQQSPAANNKVNLGTAVNLTVSLGAVSGLPPKPETVAPRLDNTITTTVDAAISFLYTGSNPIQTGVTPGTIEAKRAAVVRGKVLNRDNQPLSGVVITILNHPELGQTLSRADGLFDLAVNGGGQLTVRYVKDGFLAAQRAIVTPWQDYVWLPDVVMIPFDTAVTAVDLSVASMQVARGNTVSDADGARRATILFPPGTTATMVLPDGSTQPLTTLNVRATEYTVGASGPKAMPVPLPPSSGYTYAAELSVDEAVAAGATEVRFNQALPVYVENFLSFPVGGIAPVGFYDWNKAAWIPSANGRVIKVLSITNNLADLDIDGSGNAATATALAILGATDAERQQLATLYAPGQSLWRVPTNHFSVIDANWPYEPDCDPAVQSCEPNQPPPQRDDPLDNQCEESGSVIGCENQTLGESVSVSGTPSRLNYRSDRTPGRKSGYTLSIPLSGATTLPATLKRIDLVVSVAGQQFMQSFPAAINQRTTFTWDGRDAYGRPIQGQRPVSVRIGYVYKAVPLQPRNGERAFAEYSTGGPLVGSKVRAEFTFWQESEASLGPWDARAAGLGGWTLSMHHAYDPAGKILHLGDGGRRSASSLPDVITTVAGDGFFCFNDLLPCGDGGPATKAQLTVAEIIAIGPDGTLYIPDRDWSRIRRVRPDGIITTIVGGSGSGYAGDGGAAISAKVASPQGVAIGPDGSLYIADSNNNRIRRVGLDGIITTVAGNGTGNTGAFQSPPGDGGPATQAQVSLPRWITVGPDGSLYVAASQYRRIQRVSPDGIITTLAGTGQPCFFQQGSPCGDGGPAAQATFADPRGIALGPDGSLYIVDTGTNRIRRIGPDGRISTVAGRITVSSDIRGFAGDGGPATDALFNVPVTVAVGPDGSLYITDQNNNRIRRVGPEGIITTVAGSSRGGLNIGDGGPATQAIVPTPNHALVGPDGALYIWGSNIRRVRRVAPTLPGFMAGDLVLAAEDGHEVYVFDNAGRHLKTLEALTSAVRYQFGYDSSGYLTSVTDGSGNITSIERSGAEPTAIIAPDGQRTALIVNSDGWLQGATNPAGEAHTMGYSTDGLLQRFIDPLGNSHPFTYDTQGRLIKDEDPAGGSTTLARTEQGNGYTATTTSALGRSRAYQVEQMPTGAVRRSVTAPSGAKTVALINTDGSEQTTYVDGSVTTVQNGPDPRWGMLAPVAQSATLTNPGGLAQTLTTTSAATLSDPLNLLSLTTLTDTVTLNGRTFTSVYDATTRTATSTSAAGRQSKAVIDALGRVVQSLVTGLLDSNLTYDTRGRLATIAQGAAPDERTATFGYNASGYLDTLTDPLGRTLSFAYDAAGRVTRQTLPDGREIAYAYDANGNLTSLTPPGRPGHLFRYTARDQTAEYEPPLVAGTGNTLYDYDLDKALTKITRPDGQTLDFGYDSAGRLSTLTLPTGQISYAYSATTGKLTGITAPDNGALAYAYSGALLTGTAWTGTVAGTVDRAYDNDFRVTSLSVNGANPIAFQYDADSLLTKAGNLTLARSAQNGLLTSTTLGSLTDSYSYDGFAEVKAYEAKYGVASLLRFEYDYDKLGRITQKRQIQGSVTHAFDYGYDTAGRLVEVKRDGVITSSYGYDSNGNRTHLNGSEVAHYDDQDRLTDYQGATYQYTANGELLQKTVAAQTTQYDYDELGNLRKVTFPGGTVIEYLVDGLNRRIGKKVNGTVVQAFLYQGQLSPIAELDGTGAVVSRFVYATGVNVPDTMIKGGVTYRIIKDHLGSPRLVVDVATNTVAQEMDYDAFGKVTLDTNPGFQPFGFAGGLYDRDTKFVRFGARDYDAEVGRWTVKDPISFSGGYTNLFGYVGADSINHIDPVGLRPQLNLFPKGSKDYLQFENIPSEAKDGTFIIAAHGNPLDIGENHLTPIQVWEIIKEKFEKGKYKRIKLAACNTARDKYNFAQKLADVSGYPVEATDKYLKPKISKGGDYLFADEVKDEFKKGGFLTKIPGGGPIEKESYTIE